MTKMLIIGSLIILYACGQNNSNSKPDNQIKKENLSGIYEYIYPHNTTDLIENHFIVLETSPGQLTGYYYGTSDEFDEEREGYLPAFFVAKMHDLKIANDTLCFTLIVNNNDFLTKAVEIKYKSTNDAIKAGYKNWENIIPTAPKKYKGVFKDSSTIIFNEDDDFLTKTFKKR
jgi:hypothetical protein